MKTSQFNVHMLAFCDSPTIRVVNVPEDRLREMNENVQGILDLVFYYGQNDFQPEPFPSVSIGDVIELKNELWLVAPVGFQKISKSQFQVYKSTPRPRSVRIKPAHFKQSNPVDQLTAFVGNLEGNLSNLEDSTITKETFIKNANKIVEEIKILFPFLNGNWE